MKEIINFRNVVVPTSDLGWVKPFYIDCDGKLIACRFKKWAYGNDGWNATIDMADGNELIVKLNYDDKVISSFYVISCRKETNILNEGTDIKDRDANNVGIPCKFYCRTDIAKMLLPNCQVLKFGTDIHAVRWYWDGVKACSAYVCADALEYTLQDGLCVYGLRVLKKKGCDNCKTYATESECKASNRIDIVDFEDDVENEEETEYDCIAVFLPKGNSEPLIKLYTSMGIEAHLIEQ